MIRVSRLDGSEFVVNAELIQVVERTPDTVLTLLNGDKIVVREPLDEVLSRVIAYQRQIHALELEINLPLARSGCWGERRAEHTRGGADGDRAGVAKDSGELAAHQPAGGLGPHHEPGHKQQGAHPQH